MKTETGYVELKDGKIYYEVTGEGEPLVLSHAGFVDSGMWDDQWKPFAENYRVIRYDMRGYGKSSKLDAPVVRRDRERIAPRPRVRRARTPPSGVRRWRVCARSPPAEIRTTRPA